MKTTFEQLIKVSPGSKRTRAFYMAVPPKITGDQALHFLNRAIELAGELEDELNQARSEADQELFDAAKEVVEACYEGRREWAGYDQLAARDLIGAASRLCLIVNRRLAS